MGRAKKLILSLHLWLLIIMLAIMLTMVQPWVYQRFMEDLPNSHELTRSEIKENYRRLIVYNLSPAADKLEFQKLAMSEQGRQHFSEVRLIFQRLFWGLIIALALWPWSLRIMRKNKNYRPLTYAAWTSLMTLALSLLVFLNFDQSFTLFHKLAFDNDYWLFDPATDPIILYLPEEFFLAMAVTIEALVGVLALLALYVGRKLR
ncbi:MAG: TIGR01906 family membrane protein [Eubacteriales bacterium]|nr:TIGR01906 family membrane protein [Eubacteriales bacterium]